MALIEMAELILSDCPGLGFGARVDPPSARANAEERPTLLVFHGEHEIHQRRGLLGCRGRRDDAWCLAPIVSAIGRDLVAHKLSGLG
jgi:hypothetical protein